MEQLYVITARGGSYDDAWERAEFITADKDKGDAYVAKMNALAEAVRSANIQCANWQQHYLVDHPRVWNTPYTVLDVPKWKSGEKVTQEMRDERKRLQDINIANQQASNAPMVAHSQAMHKALLEYKATFPEDVQLGMQNGYYDTSWDIDTINWLE